MSQTLTDQGCFLHPIRMLFILLVIVGGAAVLLSRDPAVDQPDRGIVVVEGRATPHSMAMAAQQPLPSINKDEEKLDLAVKSVEAAVSRDYPFVKAIGVQCDGQVCFLVGQLGDISDEQAAQSFDSLVDASLGTILTRNGLATTGPVIIDTLGGLNTGFRWQLRH